MKAMVQSKKAKIGLFVCFTFYKVIVNNLLKEPSLITKS